MRCLFLSKSFVRVNLMGINICDNIKIEKVEDMPVGDDDYKKANRYGPDNRTGSRQSTI